MMAVQAMRAVHALIAVQARLVGNRFDWGLPPFDRLRAGSSTGAGQADDERWDRRPAGVGGGLGLENEVGDLLGSPDGLLRCRDVRFRVGLRWIAGRCDVGVEDFGGRDEVIKGRVQGRA